jgi:hypothetical protein
MSQAETPRKCECGKMALRILGTPYIKVWKPLTLQHIADKPMTFNKENDLRRYCREHKLSSAALL